MPENDGLNELGEEVVELALWLPTEDVSCSVNVRLPPQCVVVPLSVHLFAWDHLHLDGVVSHALEDVADLVREVLHRDFLVRAEVHRVIARPCVSSSDVITATWSNLARVCSF